MITRSKVKSNMSEYKILHKLSIEDRKELSTKASVTQINKLLAAIKEKMKKLRCWNLGLKYWRVMLQF